MRVKRVLSGEGLVILDHIYRWRSFIARASLPVLAFLLLRLSLKVIGLLGWADEM